MDKLKTKIKEILDHKLFYDNQVCDTQRIRNDKPRYVQTKKGVYIQPVYVRNNSSCY
jgi:hypothetical protein